MFSSSHETFTNTDYILGHKTYLNKCIIDFIQCMLVDYNENKVEISNTKIAGKTQNIWRLNNILQNNIQIQKKPQKNLKILN